MINNTIDILSYTKKELKALFQEIGEPAYRANQLFSWLHLKRVTTYDEMSNLPEKMRRWLRENAIFERPAVLRKQISKDGTEKYLLGFSDGNAVETVAMEYEHGVSLCISTQVGCRMGCAFCASTVNGLVRSLTASEMLMEVYESERQKGKKIDSVVLMGIGEPLDNLDAVVRFYEQITDEQGYGMKNRSVTVSTCGIAPKIYELADMHKQLTLSLSLHSAFSDKRSRIMPVNLKYPLPEVLEACKYYVNETGRRITFEYTVIHGTNDMDEDVNELVRIAGMMQSHVNVIPVNSAGRGNFSATRKDAEVFASKLNARGVNATVRRTLGEDISAACGQLRRETQQL
ncbi:MAG: 23S rRNA (adenine(2503)-C(2))-methyltransferase RlmN [Oscillospiraceae bacterium]|nr:23S rRNA (adenine(2503)-C(2))-methyltransferase RlmN [Oscillospiraceae bacterium]